MRKTLASGSTGLVWLHQCRALFSLHLFWKWLGCPRHEEASGSVPRALGS